METALEQVNRTWLFYLAVPAAWATFFSFFNRQPLRGLRNFGILGCYVVALAMAFKLPWRQSATTWLVPAATAGVLYFLYEVVSYIKAKEKDSKPRISTLFNGLMVWPIMLPEVVEYTLAGAGILKTPQPPVAAKGDASAGVA